MRLALAGLAIAATAAGAPGAATAQSAAGCSAPQYQAGLAAAAAHLRAAPPDLPAAGTDIGALLRLSPSPAQGLAPVIADLSAQPPLVADALQRLEAMGAALEYPPNSTCADDGAAARAALHSVYASPAFRHLDDQRQQGTNPLVAAVQWLGGLIGRAAGGLGPLGGGALLALLLALAAILAIRALRRGTRSRLRITDEPASLGDDPTDEWRRAERAAAAGDHREAIRRAFRSALLEVAISGRVTVDAAWTTRELLARCAAEPDVLVALASAAASFDRAWYSGALVTPEDWQMAAAQCRSVRRLSRPHRSLVG